MSGSPNSTEMPGAGMGSAIGSARTNNSAPMERRPINCVIVPRSTRSLVTVFETRSSVSEKWRPRSLGVRSIDCRVTIHAQACEYEAWSRANISRLPAFSATNTATPIARATVTSSACNGPK